jgi:hypothetical protein
VALLRPTEVGVKVTVVANDAPVEVVVQDPLVTAENADADVPVAAKVTVGGVAVQPPSFKKVVMFAAVAGLPCGAVGAVRLPTAISKILPPLSAS